MNYDFTEGMFAELVLGTPGAGKSTYCEGKRQFLTVYDPSRPVITFNLDPANDGIFPYPCDINICELITCQEAMTSELLGPNGTYLYCSDSIGQKESMGWIKKQIKNYVDMRVKEVKAVYPRIEGYPERAPYLLIDCPGQVEFYLNSSTMKKIVTMLQKELYCNVCVVHLTDALMATRDIPTYISACLLSLSCMVDLELPHVNVLTKWDALSYDLEMILGPSSSTNNDCEGEVSSSAEDDEGEQIKEKERRHLRKMQKKDLQIGDFYELFLQPGEFFRTHMRRVWKMLDKDKYRGCGYHHETTKKRNLPEQQQSTIATTTIKSLTTTNNETPARSSLYKSKIFRLSATLADVIDGYAMVSFEVLAIQDQNMMVKLTQKIDNAMGNLFL